MKDTIINFAAAFQQLADMGITYGSVSGSRQKYVSLHVDTEMALEHVASMLDTKIIIYQGDHTTWRGILCRIAGLDVSVIGPSKEKS